MIQHQPPELYFFSRLSDTYARTGELLSQLNTIKQIREELGLSQTDLAHRLGVQQSTVSKLENDQSNLTLGKLVAVIEALGGEWKITLKFPTTEEIELSNQNLS
jgi:transcriptional regulator with XRE-family HTH domain